MMQNGDMETHERLRRARIDAGFKRASDAARALGVKTPTYLGHENGSRAFDYETARRYGRRFGVSAEWLLSGDGTRRGGIEVADPRDYLTDDELRALRMGREDDAGHLPVLGEVAAGAWLEVDPISPYEAPDFVVPVPLDPRFPKGQVYGLRVRGSSINKIAEEGDILVCLDIGSGIQIVDRDLVVVERRKAQEGLREVTAKRIRILAHRVELWPESDDPRWQEPIVAETMPDNEDDHFRIIARVEWVFRPLRKT